MNRTLVIGVIVAVVLALAGRLLLRRDAAKPAGQEAAPAAQGDSSHATKAATSHPAEPLEQGAETTNAFRTSGTSSQITSGRSSAHGRSLSSSPSAAPPIPLLTAAAAPQEPSILEPLARAALRYVGTDPAAEETWVQAINDPNLSEDARSNLIEDLNEDGFPDPSNITRSDFPLILARLELIERLAPFAMDEVNAAAFHEAYKDLLNMYVRLGGTARKR